MALIVRSQSSISGLNASLNALQSNIDAGNTAASQALAAATLATNTSLTTEQTRAEAQEASLLNTSAQKSANLSDLVSASAARTNIDVFSKEETTSAITTAKLSLGTNINVADLAGRNALVNLNTSDTVTVLSDSSAVVPGQWVKYGVGSVDGTTGGGTSWVVLISQNEYLQANSKESVKSSLLSNANTNVMTDAEKTVLDFIAATQAVNLDTAILSTNLNTDATFATPVDTQVPSAKAISTFVGNSVRLGGAVNLTESLVVANNRIVLSQVPKNAMIFNFGTARTFDSNGNTVDCPVYPDTTDASGKTYVLSVDTSGQLNGSSVAIQYQYVSAS